MKSISRLILAAAAVFAAALQTPAQSVNLSHQGILTSGYTWAYGAWHVTETVPDGGESYDYYISIDKYQIRIKDASLESVPLSCIPETNYTYNEMDADMFGVGPDEKLIEFVGRYGEDTYLFISRKDKTISHFNSEDRAERGIKVTVSKAATDDSGVEAFRASLASSPIVGTWQNIDDADDVKTFTADNLRYEFIPADGGGLEHYLWGVIYRLDESTGLLKARSPFDTEGRRVRTYKRAD